MTIAEPSLSSCAPNAPTERTHANHGCGLDWRPLTRRDLLWIAGCLAVIVAMTFTKLPPGICSGDCGELQLASRTLGITHPPGYPVLASLGYLATCLSPFDPAYAVTLACYAAGLALFVLCALMQVRLGVPISVAVTVALGFLWPSRTWINLMVPEVYAPTLAFQAASAYLLLRYEAKGRTHDLASAAFSFGIAMASRPPLVLALPFVLFGWWRTRGRKRAATRRNGFLRELGVIVVCGAMPAVYSVAYLYVRDDPSTPYNDIHIKDTECDVLPCASDGFGAKAERVLFQLSGCEYSTLINREGKHVRQTFRWFRNEVLPSRMDACVLIGCVIACGGFLVLRRSRCAAWPMLGMMVGSMVYICAYKAGGQAADYFPLLWSAFVWIGVGVSPLFTVDVRRGFASANSGIERFMPTFVEFLRRGVPIFQKYGGALAFAIAVAFTVSNTLRRPTRGEYFDATRYVAELDLATLPTGAVICVMWTELPAVLYARYVLTNRSDVEVVGAHHEEWPRILARFRDRPIFCASPTTHVPGFELTRFRNIKRMQPVE